MTKNETNFIFDCRTFVLILFLLALAGNVLATPRYAAKYKQSCNLCHVNPSGGGMRTLYGAQFFSKMDVPWTPEEDFESLDDYNPKLSDNFQYGGDFRSIYWATDNWFYEAKYDQKINSFLTMQADLYFAITPADKLLIYIEKGIGSAFEAYVLMRGLTETGVLKVGRFVPSYGWRFADHKSYVREFLGFTPYNTRRVQISEDSGVEFGFYPMEWEFSTSITNGSAVLAGAGGIDVINEGKAITVRLLKRFSLGEMNLTLGSSYRYAEFGRNPPFSRYAGGFWGLNFLQFTLVGETDWVIKENPETKSLETQLVTTQVLNYQIRSGLNLFAGYDFWDPDIDKKIEDSIATRYKLGLHFFPSSYFGLSPVIYLHDEFGLKFQTGELMFHVWF